MELPPCPACGAPLAQDSPRGRARCTECGFSTPMELDVAALQRLLTEASPSARELERALSVRSQAGDAARGALRPPGGPQHPALTPPPVPAVMVPPRVGHIDARRPPSPADPRAPLPSTPAPASTPTVIGLRDAREGHGRPRRRELDPRGELLR